MNFNENEKGITHAPELEEYESIYDIDNNDEDEDGVFFTLRLNPIK
jgi:hypothetical protein